MRMVLLLWIGLLWAHLSLADSVKPVSDPAAVRCAFELSKNVFTQPTGGPFPYDKLTSDQFAPAFEHGLLVAQNRLAALKSTAEKPTFENTVPKIEFITEAMDRVLTLLQAYKAMNAAPELQAALDNISSQYQNFLNQLKADSKLHSLVEQVTARGGRNCLTEEENTLLTKTEQMFDSPLRQRAIRFEDMKESSDDNSKPAFAFDNVLDAALSVAKRLYGVRFLSVKIPVWHESVRAFEVVNRSGGHLGYYYIDPFPRAGKHAGSWTTDLLTGGYYNDKVERPQIVTSFNLNSSSLLTARDVGRVFHQVGHALHDLLSQAHYRSLFGSKVESDFAELPALVNEFWIFEPDVFNMYAGNSGVRLSAVQAANNQASSSIQAFARDAFERVKNPSLTWRYQVNILEAGATVLPDIAYARFKGDPPPQPTRRRFLSYLLGR